MPLRQSKRMSTPFASAASRIVWPGIVETVLPDVVKVIACVDRRSTSSGVAATEPGCDFGDVNASNSICSDATPIDSSSDRLFMVLFFVYS